MPRRLRLETIQIEGHKEIRDREDEWRALHIRKREYPLMRGIHVIYLYIGFLKGRQLVRERKVVISQQLIARSERRRLIRRGKRLAQITETYEEEMPYRQRRKIKRYLRVLEEQREIIRARRRVMERSKLLMWRIINPLQSYIYKLYAIDRVLLDQPLTIREAIKDYLVKIARKNPLYRQMIEEFPLIRHYAKRYILYYQLYPHTHNIYAVRLSPLTMTWLEDQEGVYYVSRVISAEALKQTALLESSTYVTPYILKISSKRSSEYWNSASQAGRGKIRKDAEIALARDDKQQPIRITTLLRAIFRPHEIKRAFARMLGRREIHDEVETRCVYAMIGRRGKRDKLYEAGTPMRVAIKIRRRRIKDFLYYNK